MRILLVTVLLTLPAAVAGAQSTDEPNAASRFIRDVAGDYVHFVSVENAKLLVIGGAAAGGAHAADQPVATWVQTNEPSTWVGADTYGSQWTHVPVAIAWWAIASLAGSEKNA